MPDNPSEILEFEIRLALPAEERAGRMLLPAAFKALLPPILYVAVIGKPAQVIGSAALLAWRQGNPPGFKVEIRVALPFRRRGIGATLLRAAMAEARSKGMKALYASGPVEVGSDEAAMWGRLGFSSCITENHYDADPHRMWALLDPVCRKMAAHGWVPADARVVPLVEAPAREVAALHARHLGGAMPVLLARVRGKHKDAFHPTASLVLMVGDRVGGILLARRPQPGVSAIDACVVAPELRLGWANALLKLHAAQNAIRDGIQTLCFTAHESHPDTRQLAASTGAILVKTDVIPYRLLGE
jgi:GNAT superfamily N-acetyltransferase